MPFLKFHLVSAQRLQKMAPSLTERLQEAIGCPREHIVLERMDSLIVTGSGTAGESSWPYVVVEYFRRTRETDRLVAGIVSDCLRMAGYMHSDVYFRYLEDDRYYVDGRCREDGC